MEGGSSGEISVDDPRAHDASALLRRHLEFANLHTRPEEVHALDIEGLLTPGITFYGYRRGGVLLGVGALKRLDANHAEIKSMHTALEARCHGVGAALVDHIIKSAIGKRYVRLSLETGAGPAFAPARSLYARAGFMPCGPFGQYEESPNSYCMTLELIDRKTAD